MSTAISKSARIAASSNLIVITSDPGNIGWDGFEADELKHIRKQAKNGVQTIVVNRLNRLVAVQVIKPEDSDPHEVLEQCRNAGNKLHKLAAEHKLTSATVAEFEGKGDWALAMAEGIALSNYQFLKYFKDKDKRATKLTSIQVFSKACSKRDVELLHIGVEGTTVARTLVNEPLSFLTAVQLGKEIVRLGKEAGFKTEVLNRKKIESLKMGGVLAVNRGSVDPPTFSIMEWKPKGAVNKKPFVLVGKGIVYDTGGLSLKPTANSMDFMKSDMAGSAAAIGTMYAIAKAKLPIHIVALVPATDNRPGVNAYAPGDVITMYDGTTVEVMNTDAEGRLVLADALTYAQKYKPELVIDLATLTGAAVYSIGTKAIVSMGSADSETHNDLKESGYNVFERLAEMPFWDDYAEELKSPLADLKNLGGSHAGQITAGKFLEHFTKDAKGKASYPWIHLDIAGPSYLHAPNSYRGKNGTGVGVRLLFDFFKRKAK